MSDPKSNMRASYAAADEIPYKLVMHPDAPNLRPIHVQWMPTNKCNLNCSFCSCSERDMGVEMDWEVAAKVIDDLHYWGCRAVTITGGGEPLCHPQLNKMITRFSACGMDIGLVTNGTLLHTLPRVSLDSLTWCRISHDDSRPFTIQYHLLLMKTVLFADVDWAFSYVISSEPKIDHIKRVVDFAERYNFTHVRIVTDILNPDVSALREVREALQGQDDLVIYQPRRAPGPGNACLIGYPKPVILPDWRIAPCCGYQYAHNPPTKDLPDSMAIGDARDLAAFYDDQKPHNFGCTTCYYMGYNHALAAIRGGVDHGEFV